jgi:hypothetical protein
MKVKENILNIFEQIHATTPNTMRWLYLPAQIAARVLRNIRINLWVLDGLETYTREQLTILYAGSENKLNYFMQLGFAGDCKVTYLGKAWLPLIFNMAKRKEDTYSLFVADLPSFLTKGLKKNYFHVPCWIKGEIDIPDDCSSRIKKNRSLQSDMRRIKKFGLDFETTNEDARFHSFYHDMYLPYINNRYGDVAIIEKYPVVKKQFSECDLILIKSGNQEIAGGLIARKRSKARLFCFGIKDSNLDYVRNGAMAALYHYSIQYLREKGCKKVDLGGSRPFLRDGVLTYKRKWGLKLTSKSEDTFVIKLLKQTGGSKGFLVNNPFIFNDGRKFIEAIFVDSMANNNGFLDKILDKYYYEGLSGINVYSLEDQDTIQPLTVSVREFPMVSMQSVQECFN